MGALQQQQFDGQRSWWHVELFVDEYARYLPLLFVIVLVVYLLRGSRHQTLGQTVPVQIRRAAVAQKHHDIRLQGLAPRLLAVSYYSVTFEIMETREQVTFSLSLDQFAFLDHGVSGNLTSQGTNYLGFEADVPLKDPNRKESGDDEIITDIKVLCEECGQSCIFPVTKLGTVQQCAHCRAYVDVECKTSRELN